MRLGSQCLLAHEPMCVEYTLRKRGTSPSSANDTLTVDYLQSNHLILEY